MSETMTVLMAAFGGGLAGAVLQPITTHILQRLQFKEEIRKERQRNIRRMLAEEVAAGKRCSDLVYLAMARAEDGHPLSSIEFDEGVRSVKGDSDSLATTWQPWRIEEHLLARKANEHHSLRQRLITVLSSHPYHAHEAEELAMRLEDQGRWITIAMDVLNWPESEN